ncbi:hypothetical protein [Corynebacterium mastitidis]|uniref:hypothetical protein n=1 Tax=Corynebacterium mastitidis TaxID=161890 RepID=UPI00254D8FBA|nr:hypothetical protein [Corynebacterium mastitidis]MDK8451093.1 hypothetical protein [Corynebacterium mastitidis]
MSPYFRALLAFMVLFPLGGLILSDLASGIIPASAGAIMVYLLAPRKEKER